jgi:DNA-binding MarR family transcriptional regulator
MSGPQSGGAAPSIADGFRALSWIGIIEQLQRNRAERLLRPLGLSYAEFAMLSHFSHGHPPAKTVGGIAADMQLLQPAVTKTAAKLLARGALKAGANERDGRSRLLTLTARGRALFERAVTRLAPDIAALFEGWSAGDVARLFEGLDRLKARLDAAR